MGFCSKFQNLIIYFVRLSSQEEEQQMCENDKGGICEHYGAVKAPHYLQASTPA
jgi:hypothetical protein